MGVGCGDLRVQCWNVNSMMKSSKSWAKFVNKKIGVKVQFKTLHIEDVDENGVKTIRVVQEQNEIEQEVREFYRNLYSEKEAKVDKNEILQNIEEMSKIKDDDACTLERGITEGEVAVTLLQTKNNVAPGPGGFGGGVL